MPIYEYRCRNGHSFEIMQSMSDDPVSACEQCGAPVERVFHPVAVHFKGSGFYTTDYKKKGSAAKASSDGEAKADTKADSKSESKPEKKAEAKKEE
jgi:putative FmdB family regulatory protein